jgi:hypothetical protein
MEQDALQKLMAEYAAKIKSGAATVKDFSDMKNAIRATYDAGNLDKEAMTEMGKKATFAFKNKDASRGLADLAEKVIEKGGTVTRNINKIEEGYKPVLGKVFQSAKDAGKKVRSFAPLLGMLGAGAAAMGVGEKAMAGDFRGAGMEAADLATDYIPGISQAKMALQSDELGKGSDVVGQKPSFDFTPFRTNKAVNDSPADTSNMPSFKNEALPEKKERTKYSELRKMFGK